MKLVVDDVSSLVADLHSRNINVDEVSSDVYKAVSAASHCVGDAVSSRPIYFSVYMRTDTSNKILSRIYGGFHMNIAAEYREETSIDGGVILAAKDYLMDCVKNDSYVLSKVVPHSIPTIGGAFIYNDTIFVGVSLVVSSYVSTNQKRFLIDGFNFEPVSSISPVGGIEKALINSFIHVQEVR